MLITSNNNEKIKYYKSLQEKKYRRLNKQFLIEGEHLVIEAIKKNIVEELILIDDDFDSDLKKVIVTKDIMRKISMLETPPNIMALCNIKENNLIGNKLLLLDNIQDPGNLGTIIRNAVAFNIDTLVLSEDTVDIYNSKVIRGSQGMFFHINIVNSDLNLLVQKLKEDKIKVYGTKVNGGKNLKIINKEKEKFAIILGNEGLGVKEDLLDNCDELIYIEMNEKVESLNVGVASGIILYEFFN